MHPSRPPVIPQNKIKPVHLRAQVKIPFGEHILLGGIEKLCAAGMLQAFDLRFHSFKWPAFQQAPDIPGAERVLIGFLRAGQSHAYQRNLLRIPAADIPRDGGGVYQTAAYDLIRAVGIGDALRTGAGGVHDRSARKIGLLDGRGRIAKIEPVDDPSAALAAKQRARMRAAAVQRRLHITHGDNRRCMVVAEPRLHRERAEHIDDHGQAPRLPCTLHQLQNADVHPKRLLHHPRCAETGGSIAFHALFVHG